MRPHLPDLGRSALLVIDMQEYFRDLAGPVLTQLPAVIERRVVKARDAEARATIDDTFARVRTTLGDWPFSAPTTSGYSRPLPAPISR